MKQIKYNVVEVINYTCDICRAQNIKQHKCDGCELDICSNCGLYLKYDLFSGYDYGDYPSFICKSCNKKMLKNEQLIETLRDKFDTEIESIYKEWKKSCKESINDVKTNN